MRAIIARENKSPSKRRSQLCGISGNKSTCKNVIGQWRLCLRLFFLQGLEIAGEVGNALLNFVGMSLAHTPEYGSPDGHVLRSVGRNLGFASQHSRHFYVGEFPAVFLGELGQIRRRLFQRGCCGTVTFRVLSMTGCAVVVNENLTANDVLSRELQDWVGQKLGGYQKLMWIEYLPELPKTVTGKLRRFKLRELQKSTGLPDSGR